MKRKLVFAVVTATALLGASSVAFAQAGLDNARENDVRQYDTYQQPSTTGSATYDERQAPRRYTNSRQWQGFDPSRNLPEPPIVPAR